MKLIQLKRDGFDFSKREPDLILLETFLWLALLQHQAYQYVAIFDSQFRLRLPRSFSIVSVGLLLVRLTSQCYLVWPVSPMWCLYGRQGIYHNCPFGINKASLTSNWLGAGATEQDLKIQIHLWGWLQLGLLVRPSQCSQCGKYHSFPWGFLQLRCCLAGNHLSCWT